MNKTILLFCLIFLGINAQAKPKEITEMKEAYKIACKRAPNFKVEIPFEGIVVYMEDNHIYFRLPEGHFMDQFIKTSGHIWNHFDSKIFPNIKIRNNYQGSYSRIQPESVYFEKGNVFYISSFRAYNSNQPDNEWAEWKIRNFQMLQQSLVLNKVIKGKFIREFDRDKVRSDGSCLNGRFYYEDIELKFENTEVQ